MVLRYDLVVDGVVEVVLVLVMLRIIKVEADLVPGIGMVLSLDKLIAGLAPISVDSGTNLYYAEGIQVLVTHILNQVSLGGKRWKHTDGNTVPVPIYDL